jgi:hypothetical protein
MAQLQHGVARGLVRAAGRRRRGLPWHGMMAGADVGSNRRKEEEDKRTLGWAGKKERPSCWTGPRQRKREGDGPGRDLLIFLFSFLMIFVVCILISGLRRLTSGSPKREKQGVIAAMGEALGRGRPFGHSLCVYIKEKTKNSGGSVGHPKTLVCMRSCVLTSCGHWRLAQSSSWRCF